MKRLSIEKNVIKIESKEQLVTLIDRGHIKTSNHLIILCPTSALNKELEKICSEGSVYSIVILDGDAETIALKSKVVPIFTAPNINAAISLVEKLVKTPFEVVENAFNADSVTASYLTSHPS